MNNENSLKDLVEQVTRQSGFTNSMDTQVLLAEPGEVHLKIHRKPELEQFNGFFHGGVISGLADHAAGGAITTALPEGKVAITIDLHVNYLAPANGEFILAKARAIQLGKSICTANVEVFNCESSRQTSCAVAIVALRVVGMYQQNE